MPLLKKSVLFSEVTGVVLDNGKPLAGIVVERRVQDTGKEKVDTTITDSNGNFCFNAVHKPFSFPRLFPHEIVIGQRIILNVMNKQYKAWICVKRNYDNNGELGGPISIVCDLKNEYQDNGGRFMGICRLR